MKALICLLTLCIHPVVFSETLSIAVSSNFYSTANDLLQNFSKKYGVKIEISTGSSAMLYSQIVNGAPFDIFLSADTLRPKLLSSKQLAYEPVLYARGKLVLAGKSKNILDAGLAHMKVKRIAMANPEFAPYGLAAFGYINKLGMINDLKEKIVYSNNVAQSFQYLISDNVELAFISLSQAITYKKEKIFYQILEINKYPAILQSAIILKRTSRLRLSQDFLKYLLSNEGKKILLRSGYD